MEPTQGSPAPGQPPAMVPKKRRRRWLIVAFVLGIVSLISWWYWPRGDSRFVGKWRVLSEDDLELPGLQNTWIRFDRNGAGQFLNADGTLSLQFPWKFAGERFRFRTPIDSAADLVVVGMAQEYLNPNIVFGEMDGIVNRIEPDSFELLVETFENEPRSMIRFRRIPE
jgi:hypothetical protein